MNLSVRPSVEADLPALVDLFNHTVRTGGTTAHEDIWDVPTFKQYYFDDPASVVTVLLGAQPIGFQALFTVADGSSIGSFTDQRHPVRGAGSMMFEVTRKAAKSADFAWIDAKIRADNTPGLAYYSKMGFVDHKIVTGVPLTDGTPVDRIIKRLWL